MHLWWRRLRSWPVFWPTLAAFWIALVFLFFRWYRLESSFLFLNDAGRDLLVLRQWASTWKPPLLGPQNSTLPFNQSALYFYWLMPIYVVTGFSWLSPHLTLTLTTLAVWLLGILWLIRAPQSPQQKTWWPWLLSLGWLTTLHPQVILQNRFIWNPSFLLPLLAPAVVAAAHLCDPQTWSDAAKTARQRRVFAASIALSFAFTYAAVPIGVALVFVLTVVAMRHRYFAIWKLWRDTLIAGLITHAPTILYELRYQGQLTRAVLSSGGEQITQSVASPRLHDLLQHTLFVPKDANAPWIALLLIVITATNFWLIRHRRTTMDRVFLFSFTTLMWSLAFTFALSTPMHSHYIFGLLLLALAMVASLRAVLRWPTLLLLTLMWIVPTTLVQYFRPASRDMATMQSCAQKVCAVRTEPVFVSGASGLLPFHNVPDWRYAFQDAGCALQNLETHPAAADTMLVLTEFTTYTHGTDQFNELTLFGPSREQETITCTPEIRVHVLMRESP